MFWTETLNVVVDPWTTGLGFCPLIVPTLSPAATYGPTNGPPLPTGVAPAGSIELVLVSEIARARFRRPLPVWAVVPAASALSARRETMTPFVAVGSFARMRAAAAETSAAEAEVPVTEVVSSAAVPPATRVSMSVPGAPRKVSVP